MKLYGKYLAMLLKSQLTYKASFVMTAVGQFFVSFTAFLGVFFLFSRFHEVEGFIFAEVLLCFSIILAAFSLAECFARGFDVFPRLIRTGDPAPHPAAAAECGLSGADLKYGFHPPRTVAAGRADAGLCAAGQRYRLDGRQAVRAGYDAAGGTATFIALFILYAGISFFTIDGIEFMNIFTDGAREFGKYPFSIYGEGVLKLLTYVIPLALFQYYPLLYLIGRSDDIRLLFLPLAGFVFLLPCYAVFRLGLRKYKSTGS